MNKLTLHILSIMLIISCSADIVEDVANQKYTRTGTTCIIPPMEWGENFQTRSSLSFTGSKMVFAWNDGDQIGVYPYQDAIVTQQPLKLISSSIINGSASGDFGDKEGNQVRLDIENVKDFMAYAPYNANNDLYGDNKIKFFTQIPISYLNQTQTSNVKIAKYVESVSEGNTDDVKSAASVAYIASEKRACNHLGKVDFLSARAEQQSSGQTTFAFKHAGSTVRFYIQVPAQIAYDFIKVKNNNGDKVFTLGGTLDLSNSKETESVINNPTRSNTITLAFNGDGFDLANENIENSDYYSTVKGAYMIIGYMELAPVTTGSCTLFLIGHTIENGEKVIKCYSAPLSSKTIVSGKVYQWTVSKDSFSPEYDAKVVDEGGSFGGESSDY